MNERAKTILFAVALVIIAVSVLLFIQANDNAAAVARRIIQTGERQQIQAQTDAFSTYITLATQTAVPK